MDLANYTGDAGLQRRYLELMKGCLTHSLWVERTRRIDPSMLPYSARRLLVEITTGLLGRFRLGLVRLIDPYPPMRENGEDWPEYAHTMVGMKRLNNLEQCLLAIIRDNIPGDLIETGVWRGGSVIFMLSVLKAFQINDRNVWAADSFQGLPKPDEMRYPADKGDICYQRSFTAVSLEEVKSNCSKYGLLDEQVKFIPGWFKDTLPNAPMKSLALIRLDGDMYESTIQALENLYPKLSRGGYVIVDDYAAPPCRQAVEAFRIKAGISDPILPVDNWCSYWRRS